VKRGIVGSEIGGEWSIQSHCVTRGKEEKKKEKMDTVVLGKFV